MVAKPSPTSATAPGSPVAATTPAKATLSRLSPTTRPVASSTPMPLAKLAGLAEQLVEDDDADPNESAVAEHGPVEVTAEHPGREREDESSLRRGERIGTGSRRTGEAVGGVEHVEHRRDDDGAENDAVDQGELLAPRGRADQLAGLEVLEIVVGDGGDAEHDRGGEQGVGDQR